MLSCSHSCPVLSFHDLVVLPRNIQCLYCKLIIKSNTRKILDLVNTSLEKHFEQTEPGSHPTCTCCQWFKCTGVTRSNIPPPYLITFPWMKSLLQSHSSRQNLSRKPLPPWAKLFWTFLWSTTGKTPLKKVHGPHFKLFHLNHYKKSSYKLTTNTIQLLTFTALIFALSHSLHKERNKQIKTLKITILQKWNLTFREPPETPLLPTEESGTRLEPVWWIFGIQHSAAIRALVYSSAVSD